MNGIYGHRESVIFSIALGAVFLSQLLLPNATFAACPAGDPMVNCATNGGITNVCKSQCPAQQTNTVTPGEKPGSASTVNTSENKNDTLSCDIVNLAGVGGGVSTCWKKDIRAGSSAPGCKSPSNGSIPTCQSLREQAEEYMKNQQSTAGEQGLPGGQSGGRDPEAGPLRESEMNAMLDNVFGSETNNTGVSNTNPSTVLSPEWENFFEKQLTDFQNPDTHLSQPNSPISNIKYPDLSFTPSDFRALDVARGLVAPDWLYRGAANVANEWQAAVNPQTPYFNSNGRTTFGEEFPSAYAGGIDTSSSWSERLGSAMSTSYENLKTAAQSVWDSMAAALTPGPIPEQFPANPFGTAEVNNEGVSVPLNDSEKIVDAMREVAPETSSEFDRIFKVAGAQSPEQQKATLDNFSKGVIEKISRGETLQLDELQAAKTIIENTDERGLFARTADRFINYSQRSQDLAAIDAALRARSNPTSPENLANLAENATGPGRQGTLNQANPQISANEQPGQAGSASGETYTGLDARRDALSDAKLAYENRGMLSRAQDAVGLTSFEAGALAEAEDSLAQYRLERPSQFASTENTQVPGQNLTENEQRFGTPGTPAAPLLNYRLNNRADMIDAVNIARGDYEEAYAKGVDVDAAKMAYQNSLSKYQANEEAITQLRKDALSRAGSQDTLTSLSNDERAAKLEEAGARSSQEISPNELPADTRTRRAIMAALGDESGLRITPEGTKDVLAQAYAAQDANMEALSRCVSSCEKLQETIRNTNNYIKELETGAYTTPQLKDALVRRSYQLEGGADSYGEKWRAMTTDALETSFAAGRELFTGTDSKGNPVQVGMGNIVTMVGFGAAGMVGQTTAFIVGAEPLNGEIQSLFTNSTASYDNAKVLSITGTALSPMMTPKLFGPSPIAALGQGIARTSARVADSIFEPLGSSAARSAVNEGFGIQDTLRSSAVSAGDQLSPRDFGAGNYSHVANTPAGPVYASEPLPATAARTTTVENSAINAFNATGNSADLSKAGLSTRSYGVLETEVKTTVGGQQSVSKIIANRTAIVNSDGQVVAAKISDKAGAELGLDTSSGYQVVAPIQADGIFASARQRVSEFFRSPDVTPSASRTTAAPRDVANELRLLEGPVAEAPTPVRSAVDPVSPSRAAQSDIIVGGAGNDVLDNGVPNVPSVISSNPTIAPGRISQVIGGINETAEGFVQGLRKAISPAIISLGVLTNPVPVAELVGINVPISSTPAQAGQNDVSISYGKDGTDTSRVQVGGKTVQWRNVDVEARHIAAAQQLNDLGGMKWEGVREVQKIKPELFNDVPIVNGKPDLTQVVPEKINIVPCDAPYACFASHADAVAMVSAKLDYQPAYVNAKTYNDVVKNWVGTDVINGSFDDLARLRHAETGGLTLTTPIARNDLAARAALTQGIFKAEYPNLERYGVQNPITDEVLRDGLGKVFGTESAQNWYVQKSAAVASEVEDVPTKPVTSQPVVTPAELLTRSMTADIPPRTPVGEPQLEAINPLQDLVDGAADLYERTFTPTEAAAKDIVKTLENQDPYISNVKAAARVAEGRLADTKKYAELRDNAARELVGRRDGQGRVSVEERARADAAIAQERDVLKGTASRPTTIAEVARLSGRPEIPGLEGKVHFLHPLLDSADIPQRVAIIMHQMEGTNAEGAARAQAARPNKRGALIWVERNGEVYWSAPEYANPSHIRSGSGLRNDNRFIDNASTQGILSNENTIGIEFAGNPPGRETNPLTPEQLKTAAILGRFLQERYNIPSSNVYAHSWIQYKAEGHPVASRRYVEGAAAANVVRMMGYRPNIDAGTNLASAADRALVETAISKIPTNNPMDSTVMVALRESESGVVIAEALPPPAAIVETALGIQPQASPFMLANFLDETSESIFRSLAETASPFDTRPVSVMNQDNPQIAATRPVIPDAPQVESPPSQIQVAVNEPTPITNPVQVGLSRNSLRSRIENRALTLLFETPIMIGDGIERVSTAVRGGLRNIFDPSSNPTTEAAPRAAFQNVPRQDATSPALPEVTTNVPIAQARLLTDAPIQISQSSFAGTTLQPSPFSILPRYPQPQEIAVLDNTNVTPVTDADIATLEKGNITDVSVAQTISDPEIKKAVTNATAALTQGQSKITNAIDVLKKQRDAMQNAGKVGGLDGLALAVPASRSIEVAAERLAKAAEELAQNPFVSVSDRAALVKHANTARTQGSALKNRVFAFNDLSIFSKGYNLSSFKSGVAANGENLRGAVAQIENTAKKAGAPTPIKSINEQPIEVSQNTESPELSNTQQAPTEIAVATLPDESPAPVAVSVAVTKGPLDIRINPVVAPTVPKIPTDIPTPSRPLTQDPGVVGTNRQPRVGEKNPGELDSNEVPPPLPGTKTSDSLISRLDAWTKSNAAREFQIAELARMRQLAEEIRDKEVAYRMQVLKQTIADAPDAPVVAQLDTAIAKSNDVIEKIDTSETLLAGGDETGAQSTMLTAGEDARSAADASRVAQSAEIRALMEVANNRALNAKPEAKAFYDFARDNLERANDALQKGNPIADNEAKAFAAEAAKNFEAAVAAEGSVSAPALIADNENAIARLTQLETRVGGDAPPGGSGGGAGNGSGSSASGNTANAAPQQNSLWSGLCRRGWISTRWCVGVAGVVGVGAGTAYLNSGGGSNQPPAQTQPTPASNGNTPIPGTDRNDPISTAPVPPPGNTNTGGASTKDTGNGSDGGATKDGEKKDGGGDASKDGDTGNQKPPADDVPGGDVSGSGPEFTSGGSSNASGGFLRGGMSLLQGLLQGLAAWFGGQEEDAGSSQPQTPSQPSQPKQLVGAIVGNPSLIDSGATTTLSWSSVGTDVSSSTCAVITDDYKVIRRGAQNGSMYSPTLTESTRFGLVCNAKGAKEKLLNEVLIRVRGDSTDPSRIFSQEQISASQTTSSQGGSSSGGTSSGGSGSGGQGNNPAPEDVRTCDPEQAMDSFIRCLCEAEPNPLGCSIPPGGARQ